MVPQHPLENARTSMETVTKSSKWLDATTISTHSPKSGTLANAHASEFDVLYSIDHLNFCYLNRWLFDTAFR